tara:strand:- start:2253 stop:2474 length:222 start_codon:yes stop_codon:yes gene_type:complete
MNTIQHYASLISTVNSMQSRLSALGYEFKEIAPITPLDEQLIDALVATATAMLAEAAALKLVAYDPTPDPEAP